MSLTHSPDTHKSLIARIPFVTGRSLSEWFGHLESGPAFFRREERSNWLADEHGICDRYAVAIVREYEIQRHLRRFGSSQKPCGRDENVAAILISDLRLHTRMHVRPRLDPL